ncbi:flagellar biosynthetic protein FliO [Pseudoxanthomonas composti]|uniref:Flagellar protein n=1 Tax=Pseudoxanthomonas composti TaxID=2137479 RepID=A0A4Q1JTX9_9GAMM|nr:flagellar biosynthetic protein FliO [Pseudoxanthomonas composti]RXR02643.1 flagellar biosynthetic protein FliO [Pseudoxanthomonas composti]
MLLATAGAVARSAPAASSASGLLGGVMALLLVLGLILGLAWLLKRMPGSAFRQNEQLKLIATLPLGTRERAVVVQVGQQQLLLGVSAGSVTLLQTLPEPLQVPPSPQLADLKKLPDFAQLLAQRMRKDSRK